MSYLFNNYARQNIEWITGEGCHLESTNGEMYLDFTSGIGVNGLGYQNAKIVDALNQQADQLWHVSNLYQSSHQEKVAKLLCHKHNFLGFFCNSGTEANEAAIKLARKYTGKSKIITFRDSFHGRSYGGMSATGQDSIQAGFTPMVPEFYYATFNDIASVKELVDNQTAAVMLELIQGESGIHIADQKFIKELVELCQELDVLIIVDEVQTGIGRTGTLFAFEQYDFTPDIVTLAKGLGNGVPVGAMLGKNELASGFPPGAHGSTFGGNLLAMAAAEAVLSELSTTDILNNVILTGETMLKQLKIVLGNNKHVIDIRGKGYMIGIEVDVPISDVMAKMLEQKVVVLKAGTNVIRLLPPLIMKKEEFLFGIDKLAAVLATYD